ncbi:MAG TPA: VWA domain-containing protein [Kofleriaceae bacterium]|nr:VWA domain-containing protein [Kofleriaceae bacterium]
MSSRSGLGYLAVVVSITCAGAPGCGGSNESLRLTMLNASARRPSNVAVYFTVDTAQGEPVPGLTAESFQIYEDDQPVSVAESKQTILNPEVAAEHYTLLLVDMSGSVADSDDVPVITQSVQAFASRVEKYQKVAVYAFDGSPRVHEIVGFSSGEALASGAARLDSFRPRDPSTNLNGAILEAFKLLDRRLRQSRAPLVFGTLVVFTDGTDRAGRVTRDQLYEQLDQVQFDVLVIGVGDEIDPGELDSIGRNGAIINKDRNQIAASFEDAAARMEAMSRRYYLLGYCSPARAGEHEVRIETTVRGQSGSLTYRFRADGFGPNCDPNRPPSFDVRRPPPPPEPDGEPDGEGHRRF